MLEIVNRFICGLIVSGGGYVIIKQTLEPKHKLRLKDFFLLCLYVVFTVLIYKAEYSPSAPLINLIFSIFIYKFIFDFPYIKATMVASGVVLLVLVSEILWSFNTVLTSDIFRNNSYAFILTNIIIMATAIILVKIKFVKNLFNRFVTVVGNNKFFQNIVVFGLGLTILSIVLLYFVQMKTLSYQYVLLLLVGLLTIFLVVIYIKEHIEYNLIKLEYDTMMKYVQEFEEWVEYDDINRHEAQNNLIILRDMVKSKKAKDFIDEKLSHNFKGKPSDIKNINVIPAGGLRGLVYYKIMKAKSNKIDVLVEISKSCAGLFKKLNDVDFKNLCYLLGIYLDNAIDAAALSKRKNISLEIYDLEGVLNIVISNSIDKSFDVNIIDDKGATTKGKGHGLGRHFAKNLINKTKNIESETLIVNNYFVQKIKIKNLSK